MGERNGTVPTEQALRYSLISMQYLKVSSASSIIGYKKIFNVLRIVWVQYHVLTYHSVYLQP